jgi:hypothetical protein
MKKALKFEIRKQRVYPDEKLIITLELKACQVKALDWFIKTNYSKKIARKMTTEGMAKMVLNTALNNPTLITHAMWAYAKYRDEEGFTDSPMAMDLLPSLIQARKEYRGARPIARSILPTIMPAGRTLEEIRRAR